MIVCTRGDELDDEEEPGWLEGDRAVGLPCPLASAAPRISASLASRSETAPSLSRVERVKIGPAARPAVDCVAFADVDEDAFDLPTEAA